MKPHIALMLALAVFGCSSPSGGEFQPMPGRVSAARETRDTETCRRIDSLTRNKDGFMAALREDCREALDDIRDRHTDLARFDVARAYLDAFHDFANAADFVLAQDSRVTLRSDISAFLISRQTGLIQAMHDWRFEAGKGVYPDLLNTGREIFV